MSTHADTLGEGVDVRQVLRNMRTSILTFIDSVVQLIQPAVHYTTTSGPGGAAWQYF